MPFPKGRASPRRRDITGQKFGRLTAIKRVGRKPDGHSIWLCRCECGEMTEVDLTNLRGHTRSCGCLQREMYVNGDANFRHGYKRSIRPTYEYTAWVGMLQRCYNKNHPRYSDYGGRGIAVCEPWHDFIGYCVGVLAAIGQRPSRRHSIDRYPNNDGNYEPGNVRWATWKQQANNRRRRRKKG